MAEERLTLYYSSSDTDNHLAFKNISGFDYEIIGLSIVNASGTTTAVDVWKENITYYYHDKKLQENLYKGTFEAWNKRKEYRAPFVHSEHPSDDFPTKFYLGKSVSMSSGTNLNLITEENSILLLPDDEIYVTLDGANRTDFILNIKKLKK